MKDSKNYKLFNWIVPIGVVLIFVLIELIVRIFVPSTKSSEIDLGPLTMFEKVEKKDGTWYRITGDYSTTNNNFEFKETPDEGVYRIIVLGGSAAAGWPHPADQTFSSYLETTLNNLKPTKRVEIINCAAHGFASYRVLQVFRQAKKWKPDLIIVWSGNNEFLEERNISSSPFIQSLSKAGQKIRIVQVISSKLFPPAKLGTDIDVAGAFWKKTRKEALAQRTDEKRYANVRRIYSESIGQIAKESKNENIQLLLMTVPVNLRDWQPNVSILEGTENDSLKWRQHYVNGRGKFLQKNIDGAIEELKLATDIQPKHAETWFWLAKAYEQKGDYKNAYDFYIKARDFDMNPFRAISAFNDSIRNLCKQFDAPLLDAEIEFTKYSRNNIPGFDMFIDYVHPSKSGNLILCLNAALLISEFSSVIPENESANIPNAIVKISQNGYQDDYDFNIQTTRFSLFFINHQEYSVVSFGTNFLSSAPPEVLNNKNLEPTFTKIKAGVEAFELKIEADNYEFINGSIPSTQRDLVNKKLEAFFDTYYPYGTY